MPSVTDPGDRRDRRADRKPDNPPMLTVDIAMTAPLTIISTVLMMVMCL